MSKLEELIQELCPDGVEYIAISKCVNKIGNIKLELLRIILSITRLIFILFDSDTSYQSAH